MNANISISNEDVAKAVKEWFKTQPLAKALEGQDVVLSWQGGYVKLKD
jgi:hypothetical protein